MNGKRTSFEISDDDNKIMLIVEHLVWGEWHPLFTEDVTEKIKPILYGVDLTDEVMFDVTKERFRQDQKWGLQRHPHGTWLAILGEEFGEVCEAMQKGLISEKPTDSDNLYEELIQVAAVAVAIAEQVKEESGKLASSNK